MTTTTRRAVATLVAAAGLLGAGVAAAQDAFPSKPINLIVPYPAGGLTDIVSRPLADEVSQILGQKFIIENRPGAGGKVGLDQLLRQPKDGHTIAVVVPATMITLPLTDRNFGIDPQKELAPITIAVDTYLVLVANPSVAKTLREFIAAAKANPGKFNYGTPGTGTSFHFNTVKFAQDAGIQAVHIPYKGEVNVLNDVAGGQLQFMFATNTARPMIDAGRVVPLGVATSARIASLPNVPTLKEQGLDFTSDGWVAYVAAAGTPERVLDQLNAAFVKAMQGPKLQAAYRDMNYIVRASSRNEFRDAVAKGMQTYGGMIKSGAIKLD